MLWRSPEDQPGWARPLLLLVVVAAALVRSWRAGPYLETYYAAAVRSMSMSWHNFFFASFDPAGTVTLDKLPGAFWIQALSVRLFGVHTWAIVLPQVVEGVLAVLVIYRIVRRLSGPGAGLVAAAILALSPASVALDRGNISDTLMILLLLLGADAVAAAITSRRWAHLLLAGVWVGLAFQAKMIEAWIALPALGLAYLVAANEGWLRRIVHLTVMGVVTGLVSISWMTVVTLVPSGSRPYVDGSQNDSLFHQVFVYNGFGRVDQLSPNQLLAQSTGIRIALPPPAGWDRLLMGPYGRDIAWLIPAACILAVVGLVATWRKREHSAMAGFVLWGVWLATFFATFSTTSSINPYYLAALAPPLAGLLGAGGSLLWSYRGDRWARLCALLVTATVAYQVWLLPVGGTGQPGWLAQVVVVAGSVVLATVAAMLLLPTVGRRAMQIASLSLVAGLVVVSLIPAVASVSVASSGLGPFDTPFQRHVVTRAVRIFFDVVEPAEARLPGLENVRAGAPFLMATQTSAVAAPFIYASGQEVLPIGGYTGTIPEPTLPALEAMVRAGDFHLVLQSPKATDPRLVWITEHCLAAPQPSGQAPVRFAIYYCLRTARLPAQPGLRRLRGLRAVRHRRL